MSRFLTIISFLFLSINYVESQKIEPKFTFNVELGLPVALANEPFDDIMQGLAYTSIYGQYSFPFHFHVGLGARYSLFTINEFRVPSPVDGSVQSIGGFLKLGWDKYHTDKFATDFSVKVGYTTNFATTKVELESGQVNHFQQKEAIVIEPTVALVLAANEQNAYKWIIGYSILGYGFSPQMIGLNSDGDYNPTIYGKATQHLIVGFGYTYYFRNKKN